MSFMFDKYWIDIGTPQKYLEVHHDILSQKFVSPRVAKSALDRAALPPGAVVDDKSIIDQDVTIREGVRIENSVIGKNCKIDDRRPYRRFRDLGREYDRCRRAHHRQPYRQRLLHRPLGNTSSGRRARR